MIFRMFKENFQLSILMKVDRWNKKMKVFELLIKRWEYFDDI